MTFGERLRVAIERHHSLTITEFAKRTGFSLQNLSHFLHGQREPRMTSLVILLRELPMTDVHWLILGEMKVGTRSI